MGRGLDQAGRQYIQDLVERKESDEYIRKEIARLLKNKDWEYVKNKEFVDWLRRKGWKVTAAYLWNHVSG